MHQHQASSSFITNRSTRREERSTIEREEESQNTKSAESPRPKDQPENETTSLIIIIDRSTKREARSTRERQEETESAESPRLREEH